EKHTGPTGASGDRSSSKEAESAPAGGAHESPYKLIAKNKYLVLIAAFSIIFTLVNTNGEYIVSNLVKAKAQAVAPNETREWIAGYYGNFYLWVNIAGIVLQVFAVSRIIKYFKLRYAFFVFPVIALTSAAAIAVLPTLAVARVGKTAENAT